MKKVENHLSQLDIKYITSKLGRTPTEVEIAKDRKIAWCGCKQSNNGAFCDGAHAKL